jgi:hypothetical protein
MNSESFYCMTSAISSDRLVATAVFPTPLNTCAASYEAALVYCSFVPNWSKRSHLWLTATTTVKSETKFRRVIFDDVQTYMDPKYILPVIAKKLASEFGNNMTDGTEVKLYDAGSFMGWWLKVNKNTVVEMSPTLASILGQDTEIKNMEPTVVQYPVSSSLLVGHEELYYLTCDQVQPNCLTEFGGAFRLLDTVNLSEHESVVRHWPVQRSYHALEDDILHSQLSLQLINRKGKVVQADKPEFFALLHIRRRNGARNQRQLA